VNDLAAPGDVAERRPADVRMRQMSVSGGPRPWSGRRHRRCPHHPHLRGAGEAGV